MNNIRITILSFIALTLATATLHAQNKVIYTYPLKGSIGVSAKTTIGIRYSTMIWGATVKSGSITISGNISGVHTTKVMLAYDARTLNFMPDKTFSPGEYVTVSVHPMLTWFGQMTEAYTFDFQISKSKLLPSSLGADQGGGTAPEHNLPPSFPPLTVVKSENPSPGYIYLTNFTYTQSPFIPYLIKMDNTTDVKFQKTLYPRWAQDFTPQPNGLYTYFDFKLKKYFGLDSSYAKVDSFGAVNGYVTDGHELRFLSNGNYVLLAAYVDTVDLSHVQGSSNALVTYNVIQEFDRNKVLIFEWRTQDHFNILDATHESPLSQSIDYAHCNSIDEDSDHNLILCSRNLDEISKINAETGEFIWRLGGKHNQFTTLNDAIPFSYPHDVRMLPNGNMTMFDNGNYRPSPLKSYSRALEYVIDEVNHTITKVWEYRHSPDFYASAMGSVQRLPSGNTLIGWGLADSASALSEVTPDGNTALEIAMPAGQYNYRVTKFIPNGAYQFTRESTDKVSPSLTLTGISVDPIYPNPFDKIATLRLNVSNRSKMTIKLYDLFGREVRTIFDGVVSAGEYSATLRGEGLANGSYICRLTTPTTTITQSLVHYH
ncbi:MAG: aryl-sulfate sulfotransferase [bacterium]